MFWCPKCVRIVSAPEIRFRRATCRTNSHSPVQVSRWSQTGRLLGSWDDGAINMAVLVGVASDAKLGGERLEFGCGLRPVIFHKNTVMPSKLSEMLPAVPSRVTSLFAWPALTPIAVEPVRVQFFEQFILCRPMFERALRPQQNKRASVGGHPHTSLEKC
jgi:hypothetical protein